MFSPVDQHPDADLATAVALQLRDADGACEADDAGRLLDALWEVLTATVVLARGCGWSPVDRAVPAWSARPPVDRWAGALLATLIRRVTAALADGDTTDARQAVAAAVDDLRGWYLPRSRSSVPAGPDAEEGCELTCWTLHEWLVTLAALLVPLAPALAEVLYDTIVVPVEPHAPASIHDLDFPVADPAAEDPALLTAVAGVRRLADLGRQVRAGAAIGLHQPLRRAVVTVPDGTGLEELQTLLADALGVHHVDPARPDDVPQRLQPRFGELGRVFGARTADVAAAIDGLDPGGQLVRDLLAGLPVHLPLPDGTTVEVWPEMLDAVPDDRGGWPAAEDDAGWRVALDPTVDDGLAREGLAIELVDVVADQRALQGIDPAARVLVELAMDGHVRQAVADHRELITHRARVTAIMEGAASGGAFCEVGGHATRIRLEVQP